MFPSARHAKILNNSEVSKHLIYDILIQNTHGHGEIKINYQDNSVLNALLRQIV